jgi:hypothetical protein
LAKSASLQGDCQNHNRFSGRKNFTAKKNHHENSSVFLPALPEFSRTTEIFRQSIAQIRGKFGENKAGRENEREGARKNKKGFEILDQRIRVIYLICGGLFPRVLVI